MESYSPNTSVQITFPIPQDENFVSGEVIVTDQDDNVLENYTMDAGDYGMVDYLHNVSASVNDIGEDELGLRTISMTIVGDSGEKIELSERYYLVSRKPLTKGKNSLVSYVQALMLVPSLSNLEGWYGATEEQHVAALRESYNVLSRFHLNKNFVHNRITEYSATELDSFLKTETQLDFSKAQILHANYLLGGEPEKGMRDNGVMSNSVGESTTFFRTSKPLDYGISSRAYRYISRYINRDVVINNA